MCKAVAVALMSIGLTGMIGSLMGYTLVSTMKHVVVTLEGCQR